MKIKTKTEFIGIGALLQFLALLSPIVLGAVLGGVGIAIGIVLMLILFGMGSAKAKKFYCPACNNTVTSKDVKVCPACRTELE